MVNVRGTRGTISAPRSGGGVCAELLIVGLLDSLSVHSVLWSLFGSNAVMFRGFLEASLAFLCGYM